MPFQTPQPPTLREIELGRLYEYVGGIPIGCAGELYRPHRLVLDVPVYSWKVLVEALSGNDRGLWFTCSIDNFCRRYRLHRSEKHEQQDNSADKQLSMEEGSGL